MVEFEFRQHDGRMYLPKELQKVIQGNDVKAIANYRAALIFDASVSYEDVERSMKIIFDDIRHRIESSNRSTPRAEKPAQSRSPRRKPATQSGRELVYDEIIRVKPIRPEEIERELAGGKT